MTPKTRPLPPKVILKSKPLESLNVRPLATAAAAKIKKHHSGKH